MTPGGFKQLRRVALGTTVFNFAGGSSFLRDLDAAVPRLFGPAFTIADPIARAALSGYWTLVLVFGFSYLLFWWDPLRNRALAWVATVGKLYAFAYWAVLFARGMATGSGLAIGLADLVFAAVFLWFLWSTRDPAFRLVPAPVHPG